MTVIVVFSCVFGAGRRCGRLGSCQGYQLATWLVPRHSYTVSPDVVRSVGALKYNVLTGSDNPMALMQSIMVHVPPPAGHSSTKVTEMHESLYTRVRKPPIGVWPICAVP